MSEQITRAQLINFVVGYTGCTLAYIRSKRRNPVFVRPRALLAYGLHQIGYNQEQIGKVINRDRSDVSRYLNEFEYDEADMKAIQEFIEKDTKIPPTTASLIKIIQKHIKTPMICFRIAEDIGNAYALTPKHTNNVRTR